MPETQATRKTSSARRRSQKDVVSPNVTENRPSTQDASIVQDRIRKWQVQNGTEAVDPDILSVRSQPRSERSRTPMRSHSPAQIPDEPRSTPRRRSTKWVQQDNTTWIRQRRSVRGEKRSPAATSPAAAPPPRAKEPVLEVPGRKETPPGEFVRNDSLRTRNVNSSRAERDQRRKRRREARAKANNGRALFEDGIRVYAKSESHPASEPPDQENTAHTRDTDLCSEAALPEESDELDEQLSKHTHQRSPVADKEEDNCAIEVKEEHEDEEQCQPSRYAQTLGRAPEPLDILEQPKTRKRAILSKTKEILIGKNDNQSHVSNRIPSIEAWLEEQPDMPDPFVERHHDGPVQSIDKPYPSKHRSHRKKVSIEPTIVEVEDPNKIWESLESPQHQESRKPSRRERKGASLEPSGTSTPKRRLFSFEVCDDPSKGEECTPPPPIADNVEPQSPVTLKRRGAKTVRHAPKSQPKVSSSSIQDSVGRSPPQAEVHRETQPSHKESPTGRPLPQLPKESADQFDIDRDAIHLDRAPSRGLKRKLTTHEDLLSVLSQPRTRRSTRSNKSVRHGQVSSNEKTIQEAVKVMQQEESQYVRELRTLVDGVTPVLLQSLLSKTDATTTSGLFSDNNNDADFTRPIIEMGGALQRLKSLHSRMPLQEHNIDGLLAWAITAHRAYAEYVKSWRLGFQGVIVNLAPMNESQMADEDMLSRDVDGDITNEQGQKVDVAFLQKRPLIRIKKLSRFFTTIRDASPGHEKASIVADDYAGLTELAKQRHSEEQGRLEDEAAANTDTTRARDVKTMGMVDAISIDKRRKVRARDYFDMTLQHSNGQRIDCKIEIILRDDPHPSGTGGDILICQVEESSKWLLFAPLHLSNISARRDHSPCDLVLMVRGVLGIGRGWQELLALRAEDQDAVTEWLNMLGSNPLPPKLNCTPSWQQMPEKQEELAEEQSGLPPPMPTPIPLSRSALASIQSEVDVPIGEPSVILTRRKKNNSQPNAKVVERPAEYIAPKLSLGGGLQRRDVPESFSPGQTARKQYTTIPPYSNDQTPSLNRPNRAGATSYGPSYEYKPSPAVTPLIAQETAGPKVPYPPQKFVNEPSDLSGVTSTSRNSYFTESDVRPHSRADAHDETNRLMQEITRVEQNWTNEPLMSGGLGPASPNERLDGKESTPEKTRDENDMMKSQVYVSRPRTHSRTKSNSTTPLSETIREQWQALSGFKRKPQTLPNTPEKRTTIHEPVIDNVLPSRPRSTRSRRDSSPGPRPQSNQQTIREPTPPFESRPPPPSHQKSTYTISSSPRTSMVSLPESIKHEMPFYPEVTSPLKKEYQPSSSDSSADSEDDETDATSDISDDVGSETKDVVPSLVDLNYGNRRSSFVPPSYQPTVHPSIPSSGTRTLNPSDSASQGPYRRAPPPTAYPANKKKRTIAMVCSWSDRGIWQPIQDDECSIVISPGLVQAFPMSAAHSQPLSGAEWEEGEQSNSPQQPPLVEFELTPVVPLRKGTALDITIRSPPTPNSTITTTNNVMFRSRTVQECETLYQYINWARCHNPIFAQLARDRPRQEPVTFASNVAQSKSRSWFSFGSREKTSYRAPSRPPASMADTAASSSSTTSAFSALRRFGKNSPFSLKRSSVMRRPGVGVSGSSLYSASIGTGTGSGTSTPAPSQAGFIPGLEGPNVPQTSAEAANGGGMVNNMKIRLFVRQGQKWEALGPSLLTVLPAAAAAPQPAQRDSSGSSTPVNNVTPPSRISRAPTSMPQPRTGGHFRLPSSGNTPHRIHGDGREKRILVTSAKRKESVLLDEVLGESCFEKVMQTGIAVNVWKEENEMQEYGGVMMGKSKMYMIQFRTSTEASWVFNMCGTYRYGSVVPT